MHRIGAFRAKPSPDQLIAAIARRQYGVVAFSELLATGITRREVARRLETGRLHRIHRGVYAVGHTALSHEGRWLAAVLACGVGAALSHQCAAQHSRIFPSPPVSAPCT